MLKKQSSLTLALALTVSLSFPSGAFALDYSGSQKNQATFETLEEARASGPVAVASLETNNGKTFKSHPVLDSYPKGTTYVYRSANLFGGRAAARLNTNILVFAEKSFANKDAALAYLKDLGLIKIIDEAIGSVVLVTPSDSKSGFTAGDQKYYYALQTAMLAQKASERPRQKRDVLLRRRVFRRLRLHLCDRHRRRRDVPQQLRRRNARLRQPHRRHAADQRQDGQHPQRRRACPGVPGERIGFGRWRSTRRPMKPTRTGAPEAWRLISTRRSR